MFDLILSIHVLVTSTLTAGDYSHNTIGAFVLAIGLAPITIATIRGVARGDV